MGRPFLVASLIKRGYITIKCDTKFWTGLHTTRDARTAILTRGEGKAVLHNRPRHDVKRPCLGIFRLFSGNFDSAPL